MVGEPLAAAVKASPELYGRREIDGVPIGVLCGLVGTTLTGEVFGVVRGVCAVIYSPPVPIASRCLVPS